jgi:hypothetical protein
LQSSPALLARAAPTHLADRLLKKGGIVRGVKPPPPPSSLNTGRIDHLYQAAHKTGYFTVTKSEEKLTLYQFNTNTAKHYFCSACGIYTYH